MHMADALLAPTVAAGMYVLSSAAAGVSIHQQKRDEDDRRLPTMAVTSALVFAGQMINYAVPGTGSSGHICGGMLLTALLGPHAGFLSMIIILTIQCLFFADGGLLALGANIWNMAFYGCFVGYYLIWRPVLGSRRMASPKAKITLASMLGCVLTLQLGAFSVVLETSLSGITELPFVPFLVLMQPIHLAIGLVEGAVTAAVICFVHSARPELICGLPSGGSSRGKRSFKTTIAVLAAVAVFLGGGLSLAASSNPDGLEWSIFEKGNMGLDEDSYGVSSSASDAAAELQKKTAFLPDYSFPSGDSAAGTSVSGVVGTALVAAAALAICGFGRLLRRKRAGKN